MEGQYFGYQGIFLALVLSTTVLPVPEELPVIAAGVMCGHSDTEFANDRGNPARLLWWYMLPVVIVGGLGSIARANGERDLIASHAALELFRGAFSDDLAVVDDEDPVAQRVRLVHVVGGDEHRGL